MKKVTLISILALVAIAALAQAPQGISHQAAIRDANSQLVTESPIGIKVSILQGSVEGGAVYSETHLPVSNANGLISFVLGQGTVISGVFAEIDWANGLYFIKTEADPAGGTNYTIEGISQIYSIPYAFYAETTENVEGSITANIYPPTVVATEATNIESSSATMNGIVNAEGFSSTVVFEWGTTTVYNNTITAIQSPVTGSADVLVSADLTALLSGTTYHYRIQVTSAVNVIYSEDIVFATQTSLPELSSLAVSDITHNSAISGGLITHDGGLNITARGVVWSTSENPTIAINEGMTDDGTGSGEFVSQLTGLAPHTSYHVRAYATNSIGTSYGANLAFNTFGMITDYDGNSYKTVIIGNQEWMAENLKTTHFRNGTPILNPTENSDWQNNTTGAYAWYNNDINWKDSYGALYNWHAVNNANELCPAGWHVPMDSEFIVLSNFLGETSVAGGKMKSTRTVPDPHPRWLSPNTGASNESSWSGLPGGWRRSGSSGIGNSGFWWSSNENSTTHGLVHDLNYLHADIYSSLHYKEYGLSVRCLRDETTSLPPSVTTSLISGITSSSAISGGYASYDGGTNITVRGVVWGNSENPSLENNEGITIDGSGSGEFVSHLTGLAPQTSYHVRSYATNSIGTSYGANRFFNTFYDLVTDYDGNSYGTVLIDAQEWMIENLKTTHYRNGTPIINPTENSDWQNNTTGAYAWYNNDINMKDSYGALYNWHAVNNANGLCPTGWHVPTDAEYTLLTNYLGSASVAGGKMKSKRTVPDPHPRWLNPNTGATNESKWSGLPGGTRSTIFSFSNLSYLGYWWSSTQREANSVWCRYLTYNAGDITRYSGGMVAGYSVRCLRDETTYLLPSVTTSLVSEVTSSSAISGGNVTFDGGAEITSRGVIWSTSENPTIDINEGMTSDGTGLGEYISYLTGLNSGTTYYVRAYAANSAGLVYGSQIGFSTLVLVPDYNFSFSIDTYTEITGGTLIGSSMPGTAANYLDDVTYQYIPIPFTFAFNGSIYTSFNINTNGFITFGDIFTNSYSPISATAGYAGVIAAIANDLDGRFTTQAYTTSGSNLLTGVLHFGGVVEGKSITSTNIPTGTTITSFDAGAQTITLSQNATASGDLVTIIVYSAEIRTQTLGSSPNRIHVIQMKNFKRFGGGSTLYNGELLNFQIRLHETTNEIEMVYGNIIVSATTARTAQVGLRGAVNTSFNNRMTAPPHVWTATTAGTLNNSTCSFLSTGFPAFGLKYTFSPAEF